MSVEVVHKPDAIREARHARQGSGDGEARDRLSGNAGNTVESVRETITEKAGDVKDVVTEKAGDVKEMLEKRVQDQPMMTLLGAFGVGLIVARLMR